MPLMGALYVGSSGLRTSQNALNTTAHNMSNLDTQGFTRQQILLGTMEYSTLSINPKAVANQQTGLGVYYSKVRQVRDEFLDKTYRKEVGRSSYYQVSAETLGEIESLLGEMDGVAFQGIYEDLWKAVQELSKDPGNAITQGMLVQYSSVFLTRAEAIYEGLKKYQNNLNTQIKIAVDTINDYGKQLVELNDRICRIEAGGVETANDLRDIRNSILDELSTYANIEYRENADTTVTVRIEGNDFVKRDGFYEIGLQEDVSTGYYTPFWIINAKASLDSDGNKVYDIEGAKLFDLSRPISSDLNTDIGKLRSMLLARGDHHATHEDLEDLEYYSETISKSVLMNVEAEFDRLIHNVTTKMNEVLNSGENPWELFIEKAEDGGRFILGNIQVNPILLQEPSLLSFKKKDGEIDHEKADKLKEVFTREDDDNRLNPLAQKRTTLEEYYEDLVAQIANGAYVAYGIYEGQEITVESADAAREQIVGVSSDEELSNMIMYQNAYNASSRYINVIDEMLEHIINTLAM